MSTEAKLRDAMVAHMHRADAAEVERDAALARIADYENRITWDTTCGNCARLLDASIKDFERAERAENRFAEVEAARDQILAALHVALRHADGTLTNVPAGQRAEELAGCEATLRRFANATPLAASPTPTTEQDATK